VISNHNTMFSGSGNSLTPIPTMPHHTRSRNSRWRSSITGRTYISACEGASNAISNHNTTFSGSGKSMAPLYANMCASGDMSTSGLVAAILHSSLPVRSNSIVVIAEPQNMGFAV